MPYVVLLCPVLPCIALPYLAMTWHTIPRPGPCLSPCFYILDMPSTLLCPFAFHLPCCAPSSFPLPCSALVPCPTHNPIRFYIPHPALLFFRPCQSLCVYSFSDSSLPRIAFHLAPVMHLSWLLLALGVAVHSTLPCPALICTPDPFSSPVRAALPSNIPPM